ncbi:MAG: uroporphyrinogen decarboxylase [Terriglobia bacterium]
MSSTATFEGLEVAAFESRHATEIATLISHYRGVPRVAPSMREVPLEENSAANDFAEKLLAGQVDAVFFMTGAGLTVLLEVISRRCSREQIMQALARTTVIVRGPKAARAAREAGISVAISAPEPGTWHEILLKLDQHPGGFTLQGKRVVVQEYGASNKQFLENLADRGAQVLRVPVYRWALPEDINPLKDVLLAIASGRVRVALFTNAVQVDHVIRVATHSELLDSLRAALGRCVVCSVGPTCSEALAAHGISVDLEPERHKMGILVHEAAKHACCFLENKDRANSKAAVSSPLTDRIDSPKPGWYDSRFMKACRMEPTDATPVWLMRQAGRYLKEYRALRARTPFLALCKDPDLAAEVTVSAAGRIGADAAILFADLLLIAEPMGFRLEYEQGGGPVVSPALRSAGEVDRLREVEPQESLAYVFEAVRRTRAGLPSTTPLIGFAGAPFTLASYLIEGGASKNFRHTKTLMYRDPAAWRSLMEYLTRNLVKFINGQIEAGAQAVQVFDSWVGCLSPDDYQEFVFPHMRRLFQQLSPQAPAIHFGTGTGSLLELMRNAGGAVIGLDAYVELDEAWRRLGPSVAVQGNMDPIVLYADPPFIRQRALKILQKAAGRPGHIFNLGHGVLPETPVENVIQLIRTVHETSSR